MTALEQTLTATVENLTKTNEMLMVQIEGLSEQLKKQAAQIAWLNRQLFGRKSERFIPGSGQPGLFSEEDFGERSLKLKKSPNQLNLKSRLRATSASQPHARGKAGRIFLYLSSTPSNPRILILTVTERLERRPLIRWSSSRG